MKRSALPLVRGPVGLGAQVADAELGAGEAVRAALVGGAVVGHHPLNRDAVAREERDDAAQKANHGAGLLVGQNLGIGQAAVVVDGDVHAFAADLLSTSPGGVGLGRRPVLAAAGEALADTALDAAELFDVDVDQLAGRGALVALDRLGRLKARALAQPLAAQDRRDRGQRRPAARRSPRRSDGRGVAGSAPATDRPCAVARSD